MNSSIVPANKQKTLFHRFKNFSTINKAVGNQKHGLSKKERERALIKWKLLQLWDTMLKLQPYGEDAETAVIFFKMTVKCNVILHS